MTAHYANFHPGGLGTGRRWEDALAFGFIANGYGKMWVDDMRKLDLGDRVYVRLAGRNIRSADKGFIGAGTVVTEPGPVAEAMLLDQGREVPFAQLRTRMVGGYWDDVTELPLIERGDSDREGYGEWVAGIEWDFRVLDLSARIVLPGLTLMQQSFAGHGVVTLRPDRNAALLEALRKAFPAPSELPIGARRTAVEDAELKTAADAGYDGGQGYGSGDQREVEQAAVHEVTEQLRADKWSLESVEHQKCGWDLTATKGRAIKRIEVKGTKGKLPDVLVTKNEIDKAREHETEWELWAVTDALRPAERRTHRFSAADVVMAADPVVYRAKMPLS